ncbi:MAG TPA: acetylornithine deacetylase [Silvibacterium sp.]|nr:acetylornithine deacetylase [Silvibacterium sp.]
MTDAAEHLRNLIRIPSVSHLSNRRVIDYATAVLRAMQWQTREVSYSDAAGVQKINLIAAPPGQDVNDPAADLAFFCHTDTVPYSPDWREATEPFVRDGMLHGCGACDVKGFLACLLTAAEIDPLKLMKGVRFILTADEEVGCIGAAQLIAAGALRPRRAVVGEPTSLRPARAGKGYCLAEITVFGQEAHSALPSEGQSAIYRAARLIVAIEKYAEKLAEERHNFFTPEFTTLNIGTIKGGTAKNIISGECRFQLEWRPIPGLSANSVPAAVAAIVDKLREADSDFRCDVSLKRQQSGFETSADSRLVRSIEGFIGLTATSIPFASEANLLAPLAEEVVVFGPGNMETAHSSRECVPVHELEMAIGILKSLMTGNAQDAAEARKKVRKHHQ